MRPFKIIMYVGYTTMAIVAEFQSTANIFATLAM
jgi:hypothetical protein